MSDTIFLVLCEERIVAKRDYLAKHSLYFASLFSENFCDHKKNEYPINYEVSLVTLKDFVDWAEETGLEDNPPRTHYEIEGVLKKYATKEVEPPLELLELSVVFMCERLTNDLIAIIILHWLHGERVIKLWTLAQELGLDKLRDAAFATCLDLFEEFDYSSLAELSLENLVKLIGNVNINCPRARLKFIAKEAVKHRSALADHDPNNHLYKFLLQIAERLEENCSNNSKNHPKYISCVVSKKVVGKDTKVPCIYWLKNSTLSEMMDLKDITDLTDNGKEAFGRQIIGRGFSIYVIGGQLGIGTGPFTRTIWRYCLLTKTWYALSELPDCRRHMAVGFLKNHLYIVGGVGVHRMKMLNALSMDIHTRKWTILGLIPEPFTDIPPSCVVRDKFVYFQSNLYIYDPSIKKWKTIETRTNDSFLPANVSWLINNNTYSCCDFDNIYAGIFTFDPNMGPHTRLWRFPQNNEIDDAQVVYAHEQYYEKQILNGRTLISLYARNKKVIIERGTLETPNTYQCHGISTSMIEDMDSVGTYNSISCFNIIDPATLYQQISFDHQDSINV